MASPLTVVRNNYHDNPKSNSIATPKGVSQFLFDILHRDEYLSIFDPAIGGGRLTAPWYEAGCEINGCDVAPRLPKGTYGTIRKGRFEDMTVDMFDRPDLVVCNPPFNGAPGKQLYPEVFLNHIFELWGPRIPTVMFTPMGFRLNQRRKSARWRWLRDSRARLKSIVALPLDVFPNVEFHAEILIFNVTRIKPHYFLSEEALQ